MRRSWWVAPAIVLIVLLGAAAEFAVLGWVGSLIGFWPTFGLVVLSTFVGIWLTGVEGRKAWRSLVEAASSGRLPPGHLADGALILLGGLLLVLPGFISDAFGLLLLAPWTRPIVRSALGMIGGWMFGPTKPTVIEGEVVDTTDEPPVIKGEIEE